MGGDTGHPYAQHMEARSWVEVPTWKCYTYQMVRTVPLANRECPPELHLIDAISGKWAVVIVYILSERTARYSELQRLIGGISQKVLTQTLRNLERNGVLKREVFPVVPPRVEYSLTGLGQSLAGVLAEVCVWARNHYQEVAVARERYDTAESVPHRG